MRAALVLAALSGTPAFAQETREDLFQRVVNCRLPQEACKSYAGSQKGEGRVATLTDPVQMSRLSWRVLDWADTILKATGAAECAPAEGTMIGPILQTESRYFAVGEVQEQGRPRCFVADLGARG